MTSGVWDYLHASNSVYSGLFPISNYNIESRENYPFPRGSIIKRTRCLFGSTVKGYSRRLRLRLVFTSTSEISLQIRRTSRAPIIKGIRKSTAAGAGLDLRASLQFFSSVPSRCVRFVNGTRLPGTSSNSIIENKIDLFQY